MILSQVVWFDSIVASDVDTIDVFLKNGWDINHKRQDGAIILSEAIAKQKNDLLLYLIEKGADLSYHLPNGDTLLHHAIRNKNLLAAEILIRYGLSLTDPTKDGLTPFRLALQKNFFHCLYLFVKDVVNTSHHVIAKPISKSKSHLKRYTGFEVYFTGGPSYYMDMDAFENKITHPVYIKNWGKTERKIVSLIKEK